MIYWTSKRSDVSIRYRAYKNMGSRENYSILCREPLAEVYVFLHKENHGSCVGIIKGEGMKHYESKESAFTSISEELNKKEVKV